MNIDDSTVPQARLIYLTQPSPETTLLNLQIGDEFARVQVNLAQLRALAMDAVKLAFLT